MTESSGPDAPLTDSVPEADRAEQEQPAVAVDVENTPVSIPIDVPEADAIEQSQPGPLPDEDDAPR